MVIKMRCEICGYNTKALGVHLLRSHKNITLKDYYDTYVAQSNEGVCAECGRPTTFRGLTKGYLKFCSSSCAQHSIAVNDLKKETCLKRYGSATYRNTEAAIKTKTDNGTLPSAEVVRNKIKKTKASKTVEEIAAATACSRQTRNERYAGWVSDESKEKTKLTKIRNHNDPTYNNRQLAHETCIRKYGVNTPMQNTTVKEAAKKTRIERYGAYFSGTIIEKLKKKHLDNFITTLRKDIGDVADNIEYYENAAGISCLKFTCKNCGCHCDHDYQLFYKRMVNGTPICTYCNPIGSFSGAKSAPETDIISFLKTFYNGPIIHSDRNVLNGKELDIYIPEKKLAIEFDGLYWHDDAHKVPSYHLNKTNECEKQGIQLIHIFEDEWRDQQDIVKSRLKGLMGYNERIFARKCDVKIITVTESKTFLEQNHIQGNCSARWHYGLFHNDELVAVMTFGKSRFKKDEFELLRFANKTNTNVIGGAGKLFKHFLNEHPEINKIISYADRRWSKGNLYERLGFINAGNTCMNYFYVCNARRHNRMNFQKHKLVAAGHDASLTEREIMKEMNMPRIYDCGNMKFIFIR